MPCRSADVLSIKQLGLVYFGSQVGGHVRGRKKMTSEQLATLEGELERSDFSERVLAFAGRPLNRGVQPGREQSYDHCFNYFADTQDLEADMEKSCAVLGFYLASWGMYRGSSFLLKRTNSSYLSDVVDVIQKCRPELSRIDLNNYTEQSIGAILDAYRALQEALPIGGARHITLITKIMVAAFGCVPAFDQFLFKGFQHVLEGKAKMPSDRLTADSLNILAAFYRANQNVVDDLHQESRTVAFGGDAVTHHKLSRAKIVDMYCFNLGRTGA